jgi:hypothetical protein
MRRFLAIGNATPLKRLQLGRGDGHGKEGNAASAGEFGGIQRMPVSRFVKQGLHDKVGVRQTPSVSCVVRSSRWMASASHCLASHADGLTLRNVIRTSWKVRD